MAALAKPGLPASIQTISDLLVKSGSAVSFKRIFCVEARVDGKEVSNCHICCGLVCSSHVLITNGMWKKSSV